MGKRIVIGLLFSYDENWIGGSYYILNLIHSLKLLPDNEKPELVIISTNPSDFELVKEIEYPYAVYKTPEKLTLFQRMVTKVAHIFGVKRSLFANVTASVDVLFPANSDFLFSWIKKQLYWIPDFQELHLPQFFPGANLELRRANRNVFSKTNNHVMFSSYDALNDYNHFFEGNTTHNYVVPFSVFHPDFSMLHAGVLQKYGLEKTKFFFSPNQFWKHKNHLVVLKALQLLKTQSKLDFTVAFSGKEYDPRNPDYFQELKNYVKTHNLEAHVKFLGFIDRKEQLYLMDKALAVVQPSFFEGWSTVVEDAKRLNQHCIASALRVHEEQLGATGYYFNPENEEELAALLFTFANEKKERPDYGYQQQSKSFGIDFMNVIRKI